MKFNREVLYFLLLFVNINNFYSSESTSHFYNNASDNNYVYKEIVEKQNDVLDLQQLNLPLCAILNFNDDWNFIDKFLDNESITKLVVIIADDMQDGIVLADLLSDGNRVEFYIEELTEYEVSLQNDAMRNFYLFYSSSKEAHILVYPTNAPNQVLAQYLTKRIIESASEFKFALTCKKDANRETLDSMFLLALNVLEFDILKYRCELEYNIIFLPLNTNDSTQCRYELNNLKYYFLQNIDKFHPENDFRIDYFENRNFVKLLNIKELLQALVIVPFIYDEDHAHNTCSKSLSILENDYLFTDEIEIINLRLPLLSETNVIKPYNITNLLNFRTFILKHAFNSSSTEYINSFKECNSPEIATMLSPIDIAKEFLILEKHYSDASNKYVLNFLYTEIQEDLALLRNDKDENQDNYILISAINELIFQRFSQSESIVKIHDSLDQCIVKLEKLNEKKQEDFEKLTVKYFVKQIETTVKQLNNLKLEIENATIDLNTDITNRLNELGTKRINYKINDLIHKIIKLHFLTFSKFLLFSLSIITSIRTVIGYEVNSNIIANDSSTNEVNYYEIKPPFAITKFVETSLKKFNDEITEGLKITETELNMANDLKNGELEYYFVILYQNVYRECSLSSNQAFHINECMITKLQMPEISRLIRKKNLIGFEASYIIRCTRQALKFFNHGIMNYSKIYQNDLLLLRIEEAFQAEESNLFKIEDYKSIFRDILQAITDNNGSKLILNGFAKSFTHFGMIKEYPMIKFIHLIESKVEYALEKFKDNIEIKSIINRMDNALTRVYDLRKLLKTYNSQRDDESYMEIFKHRLQFNMIIQDEKLLRIFTDIEEQAYYNDVVDYFKRFVLALKGYIYPLSENIFFPDSSKSLSKSSAAEFIEDLKKLKSKLQTNNKLFEKVKHNNFGNDGLMPAFYTWNNSFHHSQIVDLLDGKQVRLFSNISHAQNLNALKFRNIDVFLASNDDDLNKRIKYLMQDFRILLIHNGDSYYRCLDKVHVIMTNTTSIFYRGKDSSSNDYILSPFATWTMQIYGISSTKYFNASRKYANEVNVQLVGEGQYIDDNDIRDHC